MSIKNITRDASITSTMTTNWKKDIRKTLNILFSLVDMIWIMPLKNWCSSTSKSRYFIMPEGMYLYLIE